MVLTGREIAVLLEQHLLLYMNHNAVFWHFLWGCQFDHQWPVQRSSWYSTQHKVVCGTRCGHGHVVMGMWSWPCGHEHVVMGMWSWACGHGHVVMGMWSWACGHGHVVMWMWSWACGHGHVVMWMWSWACGQIHMCTEGSRVETQNPQHWELISGSMATSLPVLLPSSILSPLPSHCALIPERKSSTHT